MSRPFDEILSKILLSPKVNPRHVGRICTSSFLSAILVHTNRPSRWPGKRFLPNLYTCRYIPDPYRARHALEVLSSCLGLPSWHYLAGFVIFCETGGKIGEKKNSSNCNEEGQCSNESVLFHRFNSRPFPVSDTDFRLPK